MILFHAPRSPFSRTARIVIHELALERAVEMRIIDPWTDESLRAANPLCKVPTLQRNDGTTLYDSRVICEYLNDFAGGPLLARSGPERWDALRRQALGNGLAEAVIRRHVETLDAPGERRDSVVRRQDAAIRRRVGGTRTGRRTHAWTGIRPRRCGGRGGLGLLPVPLARPGADPPQTSFEVMARVA